LAQHASKFVALAKQVRTMRPSCRLFGESAINQSISPSPWPIQIQHISQALLYINHDPMIKKAFTIDQIS
jgi:hypothetical protein